MACRLDETKVLYYILYIRTSTLVVVEEIVPGCTRKLSTPVTYYRYIILCTIEIIMGRCSLAGQSESEYDFLTEEHTQYDTFFCVTTIVNVCISPYDFWSSHKLLMRVDGIYRECSSASRQWRN